MASQTSGNAQTHPDIEMAAPAADKHPASAPAAAQPLPTAGTDAHQAFLAQTLFFVTLSAVALSIAALAGGYSGAYAGLLAAGDWFCVLTIWLLRNHAPNQLLPVLGVLFAFLYGIVGRSCLLGFYFIIYALWCTSGGDDGCGALLFCVIWGGITELGALPVGFKVARLAWRNGSGSSGASHSAPKPAVGDEKDNSAAAAPLMALWPKLQVIVLTPAAFLGVALLLSATHRNIWSYYAGICVLVFGCVAAAYPWALLRKFERGLVREEYVKGRLRQLCLVLLVLGIALTVIHATENGNAIVGNSKPQRKSDFNFLVLPWFIVATLAVAWLERTSVGPSAPQA